MCTYLKIIQRAPASNSPEILLNIPCQLSKQKIGNQFLIGNTRTPNLKTTKATTASPSKSQSSKNPYLWGFLLFHSPLSPILTYIRRTSILVWNNFVQQLTNNNRHATRRLH